MPPQRLVERMKFRLGTMAYVFALLAAAMATFGGWGIVVAGWVLATWAVVFSQSRRVWASWLSLNLLAGLLALLLIPAEMRSRSVSLRNACLLNLKEIGLGLENYRAAKGDYPPAFVVDADGRPMHSWRVLILPYMEQKQLYDQYDFDEPWDGPNNRKLWDQKPAAYSCPGCEACRRLGALTSMERPANAAHYLAVVDEETMWPGSEPLPSSAVTDRKSKTLWLIEDCGSTAPWTAPVDLTVDDAIERMCRSSSTGHLHPNESLLRSEVTSHLRLGLFVDGHAEAVWGISPSTAAGMLSIAGGEAIRYEGVDSGPPAYRLSVIHYGKAFGLAAFLGLAVWPGVRMWRRAKEGPPV